MSPERKPDRYDLDEITNIAKENILKFGGHVPTIIVKGSDGSSIAQFESLAETHEEKARMMFAAGADIARNNRIGELWQVFFVSEAWVSMAGEDGTIDKPPSQDPNRKEVLIITTVELIEQPRTDLALFEMIRNNEGELVELKEFAMVENAEGLRVESPLLKAFVAGYRMGVAGMN